MELFYRIEFWVLLGVIAFVLLLFCFDLFEKPKTSRNQGSYSQFEQTVQALKSIRKG